MPDPKSRNPMGSPVPLQPVVFDLRSRKKGILKKLRVGRVLFSFDPPLFGVESAIRAGLDLARNKQGKIDYRGLIARQVALTHQDS